MTTEYLIKVDDNGKEKFWKMKVKSSLLNHQAINEAQLITDKFSEPLEGGKTPQEALDKKSAKGQMVYDIRFINVNDKVTRVLMVYEPKYKYS